MWVRFSAAFDWPQQASAHVAYKAGMCCNLPAAGARAAIAEGRGQPARVPRDQAVKLNADPYWTPPAKGANAVREAVA